MNIDFTRYKRVFVFGCSFTSYRWPTWADIVVQEMPGVDYYNFGLCGGGNLLMSIRITEANLRYKFNESDLVMVMWTTFCREDRYKDNHWWMTGNIFSAAHDYPEEFIRKYTDPKGYLIRDLAVITQTTAFLKTLPPTSITLASVPYDHQMDPDDTSVKEILELYKETTLLTPPCLFELEMNGMWENGCEYLDPGHGEPGEVFYDYHPNPLRYYSYLTKIGMPLTDKSLSYAQHSAAALQKVKTRAELDVSFLETQCSKSRYIL